MISFLVSFVLTAVLTPAVILVARRLGWVAKPREDRWHTKPTALMGGIGIFLGVTGSWVFTGHFPSLAPLALPAAGMFLIGAIDDRFRLPPHLKLIGQLAAGAAVIAGGVTFQVLPPLLAVPLTLVWVVGITNALNLLDNMDGLASGVCLIGALAMAACVVNEGQAQIAPGVLALAGGCAGFLIYNFNPARIFMGDCGSMFIGFTLAALAVQGTQRSASNLILALFVPVAILAIPIFDTTLVSVTRTLHGRSISQGGRDHSSHRLVALGLSERGTVLVLYALTGLFGGLAFMATQLSVLVAGVLALLLFSALMVLGFYLGYLRVYPEEARLPAQVRLLSGTFLYKRQLLQALLDILLVPVAFVGAHLLRFEGSLPEPIKHAVLMALPAVLAAKLVGLALCRAYRGVWRYAGMSDALAAMLGSAAGSLIVAGVLGLWTGYKDISRAALVIDWLMFTIFAVAARTGYAALRQFFGMFPPRDAPRVVIVGSEAEAYALTHKLRDPLSSRRAHVIGILDDDPGMHGRTLNGVPVLGPLSRLADLLSEEEIDSVLLGVSPYSPAGGRTVEYCRTHQIELYSDLEPEALILADKTTGTAAAIAVPSEKKLPPVPAQRGASSAY